MSLVSHALATLAEVKEELNVAGTNRDSVIEECINRATGIVEAYLDREVMNRLSGTDATEVTEYYSLRSLTSRLYLSQFPVISITTLAESTAWPRDYATALQADTDFVLEPSKGRVVRVSSAGLGLWPAGFRTVKVVYKPGHDSLASVPYSIRDVTRRLVALSYREIDRAQQGISAYSDAMGNVTRFGPARLTQDMQDQLAPHRRHFRTDLYEVERV